MTLDELGGEASKKVGFIRTDAKAVIEPSASSSKLKSSLASPLEPRWPDVSKEHCSTVLQRLATLCTPESRGGAPSEGVIFGINAVTRALRRSELSVVILARASQSPILYAHIPLISQLQQMQREQSAKEQGTIVCMMPCSSAQLGQPFGLLRVSALGLKSAQYSDTHPLVLFLTRDNHIPFPWLSRALDLKGGFDHGMTENSSLVRTVLMQAEPRALRETERISEEQ